jgi:cytochrome c biogenesis protein CcdA/thiol-disulfide isomerase/thioredoxin
MLKRSIVVQFCLILATLSLSGPIAGADEPVVRFFVFEAQDCEHCQAVREQVLAPLQEEYGSQVEIKAFDIGAMDNYVIMVRVEKEYGVSGLAIPQIFIGDTVLVGEEEIRERLGDLVDQYLETGGIDYPTGDEPVVAPLVPSGATAEPYCEDPAATSEAGVCEVVGGQLAAPVYLGYFFSPGCSECDRVSYDLAYLEKQYPNLEVRKFDLNTCAALNEAMSERAGVPPEERLLTPAVFIGDEYLVGDELTVERLEEVIKAHGEGGCIPPWEGLEEESPAAINRIIQRFKSFSFVAVLGAGLLDGLNPCAFTTIIFFVSYLAAMERKGREILLVGAAFTAAVFLAYLLVGAGVLGFVHSLGVVQTLSRVVYLGTGVFCLVLAVAALYDLYKIRKGKHEEMALKLPDFLQRRVRRAIREGAGVRNYVWAAAVTGAIVSLLELACTGQVYLPTIIFVTGVPELRANALLYLVLYNLMFIVPLVVIFLLVYYGTTSLQLAGFMRRHAALVKAVTVVFFAGLGCWLLFTML